MVGTGDSTSVRQIGVVEALEARGNRLINGFNPKNEVTDVRSLFEHSFWPMLEATLCDVFLTGSNRSPRTAGLSTSTGPETVWPVWFGTSHHRAHCGPEQDSEEPDEALERVKNVIAPEHLRRKGAPTPCTKSDRCQDCLGPTRVCAVTTIIERKPHTRISTWS